MKDTTDEIVAVVEGLDMDRVSVIGLSVFVNDELQIRPHDNGVIAIVDLSNNYKPERNHIVADIFELQAWLIEHYI